MLKVQYNKDIRNILDEYDIKQCQIARSLGVSRFTIGRWLAKPLTHERQAKIYLAIDRLVAKREHKLSELSIKLKSNN